MLIKDIVTLERVHRRATKFIVAASSVSYRDRLITLNLLPLMYFYEYLDLLFLVHSLKFPDGSFDHLQFSSHSTPVPQVSSSKFASVPQIDLAISFSTVWLGYGMLFPPLTFHYLFLQLKPALRKSYGLIF